jgi:type II secretory pathway pseudopilin PulG
MAVIAIIGVMGAIAMATMSRAGSAQNSAALARSLQFAMMNARSNAISDSFMRRFTCTLAVTGSSCLVEKADQFGMVTPTKWSSESHVVASSRARIWTITSSTDTAAKTPAASTGSKVVYFNPDGSVGDTALGSTGATFYVSDPNGSSISNRFKIYVYSNTGMARLVNQW